MYALTPLPGYVPHAYPHPLALGATAVGIGRPYTYGLAVGGQAGIEHVLSCLLAEIDITLAIDGYPRVRDLTPDALRRVEVAR